MTFLVLAARSGGQVRSSLTLLRPQLTEVRAFCNGLNRNIVCIGLAFDFPDRLAAYHICAGLWHLVSFQYYHIMP